MNTELLSNRESACHGEHKSLGPTNCPSNGESGVYLKYTTIFLVIEWKFNYLNNEGISRALSNFY